MKLHSLVQRTITGLLLVAVMIWAILYGPYAYLIFFSILVFGILWEYYTLINVSRECDIYRPVHSLGGTLLFVCGFLTSSHYTSSSIFLFYLVYMMIMFISRLYTKQINPLRELAFIIMGQVYIAGPIAMLSSIAFHTKAFPMGEMMKDYCPIFVLSLFFFIWINDTGAYLTGMTCSKLMKTHKLFPRVSPKKTWEGLIGGMIFAMLLGWLLSYDYIWRFFGIGLHEGVRLSHPAWIGMALVVSVFATFGDLIESFVKRAAGVKDSGKILPGHGGLWDRFDSLLMAAPAMLIYLTANAFFFD
jgi:phosphatidate cytidylyltransferase